MINRSFGLIGRFFFLAFVLWSVQNLNIAQTAPQGDQQDRLKDIKLVNVRNVVQTAPQGDQQDRLKSVKFVNTSIKMALAPLGSYIKLDVVFDDSVKNKKVTIELEGVSVREAIEAILESTESQVKMKDDHTLLIFADTPENREKYADLKSWL
jgi:type II secretory pathway component GspD/PulD (secretin)